MNWQRLNLAFFGVLAAFLLAGCQRVVPPIASSEPQADQTTVITPSSSEPINAPVVEPKPTATSSGASQSELPAVKPEIKPGVSLEIDYPVPFTAQAPYAVWDELHQEACEEAAMIMAAKYFSGESLTPHLAEQAILDLVRWETDQGYSVDLTAAEAALILQGYFGLNAQVVTDVSVVRIKKELDQGNLVIVPAAGRELHNPYFQTPGPIYHMLVIRGYNDQQFITNDPGTKRGESFFYNYQTLLNAIHDWDHEKAQEGMTESEMNSGRKVMIVVYP